MKSQAQESEDGVLSEEERLQLLTRAGQRNRLFLLALGGVLGSLMLLSVGLNLYGLFSAGDEPRIQALEQQVQRLEQQLQVQQSGKEDTGFRLLELGRVDFHPQDRAVGYAMLRRLFSPETRAAITHHPRLLNTEPLHLLFRKGDARADRLREVFNAGLRRLAENGELERLQQALYSGNADQWSVEP